MKKLLVLVATRRWNLLDLVCVGVSVDLMRQDAWLGAAIVWFVGAWASGFIEAWAKDKS